LALLLTGLFPTASRIISVVRLRFAEAIGRLNAMVLLTMIWYPVLKPFAL
jgi:hypothetical protein